MNNDRHILDLIIRQFEEYKEALNEAVKRLGGEEDLKDELLLFAKNKIKCSKMAGGAFHENNIR